MFLYIDPQTGSMLFAVVMGVVATLVFFMQGLIIKIKSKIGVKKVITQNKDKKEYVIFCDHKQYLPIFKPILDEFEQREKEIFYYTMSKDDPIFSMEYTYVKPEYIGDGNVAFTKMNMLNAKLCLTTTPHLDVYQWKRSKNCDKYIHIFHGAHATIGVYRLFGIDFFDELYLANNLQIESNKKLEQMRMIPEKKCYLVGIPYLDEMNKRKKRETKNKEYTVLISPSWGESSLLNIFKGRIIDVFLNAGYKVIVRPHPQMAFSYKHLLNELMTEYKESELLKWNFDVDNFDVLDESDIMISDFSGVMFDYSLIFNKPILYYNTNKDDSIYDSYFLDDKNKMNNEILPMLGLAIDEKVLSNIRFVVDDLIQNDIYKEKREKLKNLLWGNINNSAKTIVDLMTNTNKEQYENNIKSE